MVLEAVYMFGNKKVKESVEKNREIFLQIAEKGERFEAQFTEAEEDGKQVRRDILQITENVKKLTDFAKTNIQTEDTLVYSADEFADFFQKNQENYDILKELISRQLETSTCLVEENKHYTTPAKYLSTTPELLRKQNCSYEKHLDKMAEFDKRMSVLALNAAIEAGRMGEIGKEFVHVAEEIRQNVLLSEKEVLALKEELMQSQKQIAELEKIIQQLIKRMKSNNKGTAKLFKKCQDTAEKAETISFYGFSEKMDEFQSKLMEIRKQEEQILRNSQKNEIQLDEVKEVLKGQKFKMAALSNEVSYVFQLAGEQAP